MAQPTKQLAMVSDSASPTPRNEVLIRKYRRNGKLQSCEPCRQSKLKCDHTVPTCGRCIKRRCIEQCTYHPNPLTQNRQTPRRQIPKKALPTPSTSINHESPPSDVIPSVEASAAGHHHSFHPCISVQQVAEPSAQVHRAASAPPLRAEAETVTYRNPEFLGATSYTTIFQENLGSLGVISTDLDASDVKRNTQVGSDRIAQGCRILSFLKNNHMVNSFVSRWFEICEGSGVIAIEPIVKAWLWKFWLHHKKAMETQDPERILHLCELLWRNTQTSLVFDGTTSAMEWADLGTGANVRWEVIGIVAAIVGTCCSSLDPSDPFLKKHNVTRLTLPKQMREVAQACLSFCRECETLDDMFIWLLGESVCLTASIKGDGRYVTYQECGEYQSAIVAMGLHQDIKANDKVPFFLAELRKRARAAAYCQEVGVSSFLGRPPRLSYRHCNLEPPLDITDKRLVLDRHLLDPIVASLGAFGFDTAGQMSRTTFTRSWLGFAPRREDILDLALGQYTREEVLQRAEVILQKTEEHWGSLPEYVRKARHEVTSSAQKPLQDLYLALIRQGTRANNLLLQRVLIRKTGASSHELIHTARAIMQDVLNITQRQDMMSYFQVDMSSILAVQGLRCSAIIAVELLKQEQLPVYPKEPLLPRSQTIIDLSVFASRLNALDPSNGLYSTCQQGSNVITRILDKILSPPPRPTEQQVPTLQRSDQQNQDQIYGEIDLDVTGSTQASAAYMPYMTPSLPCDLNFGAHDPIIVHDSDFMFMQWLDSVNWEQQGSWFGQ
ncbi:hypothetical protein BJ170DRAFT_67921 [Xylariales sp. AK1849]|nr:hypothetical protein BJ170DRAFT_67921 [Xylariales sp. AK1849]